MESPFDKCRLRMHKSLTHSHAQSLASYGRTRPSKIAFNQHRFEEDAYILRQSLGDFEKKRLEGAIVPIHSIGSYHLFQSRCV